MSTAEEIYKEAERKVAELRTKCEHTDSLLRPTITDWQTEYWAFGHATGYLIQSCKICGKTMHRRSMCDACHKTITDGEIITGYERNEQNEFIYKDVVGKTLPMGRQYCADCVAIARRHLKR